VVVRERSLSLPVCHITRIIHSALSAESHLEGLGRRYTNPQIYLFIFSSNNDNGDNEHNNNNHDQLIFLSLFLFSIVYDNEEDNPKKRCVKVHPFVFCAVLFVCVASLCQWSIVKDLKHFCFAEEAEECEKTAEQAVLKVEVKTEVEEDRDQLENEVRISLFILSYMILKYCVHGEDCFFCVFFL
jgi:hypothetical protein